jgi:hypothetical protein
MATIYVNATTGNDSYDGSSPNAGGNNAGPKKSIKGGLSASSSGGTIFIAEGTYTGDDNKNFTIELNLSITGAKKETTILDAEDDKPFFKIEQNAVVNIQNLTFKNGKASGTVHGQDGDSGGAIYNEGTLTVQSCEFLYNSGADGNDKTMTDKAGHGGDGGAIWNKGTMTMIDCFLKENKGGDGGKGCATKDGNTGGNGGAILNDGTLALNNCMLYHNHTGKGGDGASRDSMPGTAGRGGAICNNGQVTISGGEICNNYTNKGGETEFEKNSNGGDAGAILNKGTMDINNKCNIHNNYTGDGRDTGIYQQDAGSGGNGGAIYNLGDLTIDDCNIGYNNTGKGGNGYDDNDKQGLGLGRGGNGGNGGAIFNNSTLTITNCTISYNGAGIAGQGGQSTIDVNASDGGNGGYGGAIYNESNGILTITGTTGSFVTINNNTAGNGGNGGNGRRCYDEAIGYSREPGDGGVGGCGGAIYNSGIIRSINYTNIDRNAAGTGGNAGSFKTTDSLAGKVSAAKAGKGGYGGGICDCAFQESINIDNSNITNNLAGNGGEGNTCSKNDSGDGASGGYGGGIYSNNSLVINNSTVSNNVAGKGGIGGYVSVNGNLPGTDCGNGGDGGQGGGICIVQMLQNEIKLNAVNCLFDSNYAGNGGDGGIDDNHGEKSSDGGAGGSGGGICVIMTNNTATGQTSKADISLMQSTISNNNSGNGGSKSNEGTGGTQGKGEDVFSSGSGMPHYNFIMYLCRIINNAHQAIFNDFSTTTGTITMQNNWWGSNDSPQNQLAGFVIPPYYTPWLVASLSSSPNEISVGQYSNVIVDLTKNSKGEDTYSMFHAYIQNGIPVLFQCDENFGHIDPASGSIVNGAASACYTATASGTSEISSKIDSQALNTSIIIS